MQGYVLENAEMRCISQKQNAEESSSSQRKGRVLSLLPNAPKRVFKSNRPDGVLHQVEKCGTTTNAEVRAMRKHALAGFTMPLRRI